MYKFFFLYDYYKYRNYHKCKVTSFRFFTYKILFPYFFPCQIFFCSISTVFHLRLKFIYQSHLKSLFFCTVLLFFWTSSILGCFYRKPSCNFRLLCQFEFIRGDWTRVSTSYRKNSFLYRSSNDIDIYSRIDPFLYDTSINRRLNRLRLPLFGSLCPCSQIPYTFFLPLLLIL